MLKKLKNTLILLLFAVYARHKQQANEAICDEGIFYSASEAKTSTCRLKHVDKSLVEKAQQLNVSIYPYLPFPFLLPFLLHTFHSYLKFKLKKVLQQVGVWLLLLLFNYPNLHSHFHLRLIHRSSNVLIHACPRKEVEREWSLLLEASWYCHKFKVRKLFLVISYRIYK